MGNEQKIASEREVLDAARSVLHDLYGEFIDLDQTDRPDAAIETSSSKKRIGIEITSVDDEKVKAYLKDEKHGSGITQAQVEAFQRDGSYTTAPRKKVEIDVSARFIYKGVVKKLASHKAYVEAGSFDEIILLCYSDHITVDLSAKLGVAEWTNYLLSTDSFPYDKVIFANVENQNSAVVYDRNKPLTKKPLRFVEAITTVIHGSFTPLGVELDMNLMAKQSPLIKPKQARKQRKK